MIKLARNVTLALLVLVVAILFFPEKASAWTCKISEPGVSKCKYINNIPNCDTGVKSLSCLDNSCSANGETQIFARGCTIIGSYCRENNNSREVCNCSCSGSNTPTPGGGGGGPPKNDPPICSIDWTGDISVCQGDPFSFTVTGQDSDGSVNRTRIFYSPTGTSGSWNPVCESASPTCTGSVTWNTVGTFYVAPDARDNDNALASGNPWCKGWDPVVLDEIDCSATDCGDSDLATVTVESVMDPVFQDFTPGCNSGTPYVYLEWSPMQCNYRSQLERCVGANCNTNWVQILDGPNPPFMNFQYSDINVTSGTTYRYRVRGCSYPSFCSAWVYTTNVTPSCSLPLCQTPTLSVSRACDAGHNIDLTWSWNTIAGYTYRLQVDSDNLFTYPYILNEYPSTSPRILQDVLPNVTRYGRVRAISGPNCRAGAWSNIISRATGTCPTCTCTANPASGVSPLNVNLTASVTGGSGSSVYRFDKTNNATYEFTSPSTAATTYTWAAGSYTAGNWTARCNVTRGTDPAVNCTAAIAVASPTPTPTPLPPCPAPSLGVSRACDTGGNVDLTWSWNTNNGSTFRMQVDDNTSFISPFIINGVYPTSPLVMQNVVNNVMRYGRVKVETSSTCTPQAGNNGYSAIAQINTGACPTPTPTPATCTMTLSGANCIDFNSSRQYQANLGVGNIVDEVRFSEGCGNVSINPANDALAPYLTTATTTSTAGNCTLNAQGFIGGVSRCSDNIIFQVGNCSPTNTPTPRPTATNTPIPTATPTPVPCICTLVLQPVASSVSIGQNQDFTANVGFSPLGCDVADSVEFTSMNQNLVPICDPLLASCPVGSATFSDLNAPYLVRSTGRGETISGPVTITAQAIVGGLPPCSDSSTVAVNPPTCTINNFSGPANLSVGDNNLYSVSVTASGGSVQIDFSINNPAIASICDEDFSGGPGGGCNPGGSSASDTDVVYRSKLSAFSIGNATLTANCIIGGVVRGTATKNITVTSVAPWWQALNADIISSVGSINSNISALCLLPTCNPYIISGTNPGVASYAGASINPPGSVSTKNWKANTGYAGEYYNYSYFETKLPVAPQELTVDTIDGPTVLTSGGAVSAPYNIYRRTGDLTINGVTNLLSRKVILMVSGKLKINGNINVNDGLGFFMAVAGGDIEIAPAVTSLEGIYFAQGRFVTTSIAPNSDTQLNIRGGVVTMSTFGPSLGRDLPDASNSVRAAEVFEFGADQYMMFPYFFGKRAVRWREIAP